MTTGMGSMDVTVEVDMNVATDSMADQLDEIADAFAEAASSLRDTPPGESSPTTRHGGEFRRNSPADDDLSETNRHGAASSDEESRRGESSDTSRYGPSSDDDLPIREESSLSMEGTRWVFDADGSVVTTGEYEFVCTVECETRYTSLERDCVTFDGPRIHEWVCPRCSHVNYTTPMLYDNGDDTT